jgi:hypothetical protein
MNEFVLVRGNPEVSIMPNWLFWLIVWWSMWFMLSLFWYDIKKKHLSLSVAFFMFLFSGFTPLIMLIFAIKSSASRDK